MKLSTLRSRSVFTELLQSWPASLDLCLSRALEVACVIESIEQDGVPSSFSSWLDLGCGDGVVGSVIVNHVSPHSLKIGLDISITDCATSRHRDVYDEVVVADARHAPFRLEAFDLITSVSVLEHVPRVRFEEIIRMLAPRGIFCFSVPTIEFARNFLVVRLLSTLRKELAESEERRLNRLMGIHNKFSERGWENLLRASDLEVGRRGCLGPFGTLILDFLAKANPFLARLPKRFTMSIISFLIPIVDRERETMRSTIVFFQCGIRQNNH